MVKDSNVIDYHFKAKNSFEYDLVIKSKIRNKMMRYIFSKTIERLKRINKLKSKDGISADTLKDVSKFKLDPIYYKFMRVTLKGTLTKIFDEIAKDKIKVGYYEITDGFYYRESVDDKIWMVEFTISGHYMKDE